MPIITLTTDWGTRDYYAGVLKGKILSLIPDAQIVDITHEIDPFNILRASFILKNTYSHYPKGAIHMVGVNSQDPSIMPILVVEHDGYYFVGSDNGLFSLVFENMPKRVFEVKRFTSDCGIAFRDCFANIAAQIYEGIQLEEIGAQRDSWKEMMMHKPSVSETGIKANVIYIDYFGNVFVNITKELFYKELNGRNFKVSFVKRGYDVLEISKGYSDVVEGERLVLFNSSGYLEIALNKGRANSLMGLKLNDMVNVVFY